MPIIPLHILAVGERKPHTAQLCGNVFGFEGLAARHSGITQERRLYIVVSVIISLISVNIQVIMLNSSYKNQIKATGAEFAPVLSKSQESVVFYRVVIGSR